MASGKRQDGEKFEVYKNRLRMEEQYLRQRLKYGPSFDKYLIDKINKDKVEEQI